jgi:hypothetical protein
VVKPDLFVCVIPTTCVCLPHQTREPPLSFLKQEATCVPPPRFCSVRETTFLFISLMCLPTERRFRDNYGSGEKMMTCASTMTKNGDSKGGCNSVRFELRGLTITVSLPLINELICVQSDAFGVP